MAEQKSVINFAREVRARGSRVRGIFAMDREGVIGYNNDLVFHNPKDLEHFKKTTTGHMIIMGTKTFESLGEKPLPNRVNIVFSRMPNKRRAAYLEKHEEACPENLHFVGSPMAILNYLTSKDQKIYVIGGSWLFKSFMPAVDTWIVTEYDIRLREPLPNPHHYIDPERFTPIRAFEHYSVGVEAGLIPEGYLEPKFRYFPDIARVRRSFTPALMETDEFISPTGMKIKYRIIGYSRSTIPARNLDRERANQEELMKLYNSTKIQNGFTNY